MSEIASHTGKEPWFPLELASWWFDKSSVVLAISLFIGFVCTVIIIVTGIAKEHHWDLLRERAGEKIAAVELEAAKSNEEAARAHERIAELSNQGDQLRKDTAEANARVAEANLQVEYLKKLRGPRSVPYNAFNSLRSLPSRRAQILYVEDAPDGKRLAGTMHGALKRAGWEVTESHQIPAIPPNAFGEVVGVTVFENQSTTLDEAPRNPASVLVSALAEVLGECSIDIDKDLPDGTVKIVIGPKP